MLIKDNIINDPLKDSYFLEENIISPELIPVVSNSRLGLNLVRYEDLNESGITLEEISESNGIPIDSLAVVINEGTMIEEPELADIYDNYVLEQVSEDSYESKLIDYYCNLCEEAMDETLIDNILTESELDNLIDLNDRRIRMTQDQRKDLAKRTIRTASNIMDLKNGDIVQFRKDFENSPYKNTRNYYKYIIDHPSMRYSNVSLATGEKRDEILEKSGDEQYKIVKGLIDEGDSYLKDMAATAPKSRIGKLIARLRNAYHGFLLRAERANNMKKAGFFRRLAARILTLIDKLAAKLQRMAG